MFGGILREDVRGMFQRLLFGGNFPGKFLRGKFLEELSEVEMSEEKVRVAIYHTDTHTGCLL